MNIINEIRLALTVRSALNDFYREQKKAARNELLDGRKKSDNSSKKEPVNTKSKQPKANGDAELVREQTASMIFRAKPFIEKVRDYLQNKEECDKLWEEFREMQGKVPEDKREEFSDIFEKLSDLIREYEI